MSHQDNDDTTRREFLNRLAATGLALSAAPAAIAAGTRGRVQIRRSPDIRRRGITLEAVPDVTRGVPTRTPDDPPPVSSEMVQLDGMDATPKNDLLRAISAAEGGPEMLNSIGVSPRGGGARSQQFQLSPGWQHIPAVIGFSLATAYVSGIKLEASGKITPSGYEANYPPLSYWIGATSVTSQHSPPRSDRVLVSPDSLDAADRTLMSFTIRTPGAENERRTYLLEMDLRGWGEIASEVHHVPVTWSRTSKDTLTSIVELGGTGDKGPGHWLRITRGNEGDAFSRQFRWLSAIAL